MAAYMNEPDAALRDEVSYVAAVKRVPGARDTSLVPANRGSSVVQPVAPSARRTGSYSVKAEVKVSAQRDAWPGQLRR
jgi:hypothetical protein